MYTIKDEQIYSNDLTQKLFLSFSFSKNCSLVAKTRYRRSKSDCELISVITNEIEDCSRFPLH